jgi:hypothetical protein
VSGWQFTTRPGTARFVVVLVVVLVVMAVGPLAICRATGSPFGSCGPATPRDDESAFAERIVRESGGRVVDFEVDCGAFGNSRTVRWYAVYLESQSDPGPVERLGRELETRGAVHAGTSVGVDYYKPAAQMSFADGRHIIIGESSQVAGRFPPWVSADVEPPDEPYVLVELRLAEEAPPFR